MSKLLTKIKRIGVSIMRLFDNRKVVKFSEVKIGETYITGDVSTVCIKVSEASHNNCIFSLDDHEWELNTEDLNADCIIVKSKLVIEE